ncbi:hypothetical protein Nepgr_000308 [Nepenthes gracilis]|uniref:Uncharacterized protein n=1 Tax=Nepenthes gracilis TaxID=150966 RepID=A0AAD3P2T7_NEPGR|nr:hypothetical protein Nepgr_000308 [Nepenthes gracilis]
MQIQSTKGEVNSSPAITLSAMSLGKSNTGTKSELMEKEYKESLEASNEKSREKAQLVAKLMEPIIDLGKWEESHHDWEQTEKRGPHGTGPMTFFSLREEIV